MVAVTGEVSMGSTLPTVGFKAVEVLQHRASQVRPGSDEEQIAEIAIGYGIDRFGSENDAQFIVRDCHRNARHTYFRSRKRGREAIASYVCRTYGRPVISDGHIDIVDWASVEEQVAADNSEFCECGLDLAGRLGPQGPMFIRRLMAGDKLAEAARAVGISNATAYRWRTAMADMLAPYRYLAGAVG